MVSDPQKIARKLEAVAVSARVLKTRLETLTLSLQADA